MTRLCSKGCGRRAVRRNWCSSHYNQQRDRLIAYGRWETLYVDAEPARNHVRNLQSAGLGLRRIAELGAISRSQLVALLKGRPDRGTGPSKRIHRGTAQCILAIPVPSLPHQSVAARARVPAVGTTRRLQALVAFGYTQSYLCERIGVAQTNGTCLFDGTGTKVTAHRARQVESLFAELQLHPGASSRARARGQRLGWALPMQWDEDTIDNPDAAPEGARVGGRNKLDADEYHDLRQLGFTEDEIAERAGIRQESLLRWLERKGIAS